VTFANAWGVCDGDLFARALKEGDKSAEAGHPFFSLVMTTSNHRPYTYPDVVPIPPGTGRDGAVQYTDFAIGEFIEDAKKHDWFDNTIFVVVGDHCASSAGKRDITVSKHHIPLLLYAPSIIEPGVNDRISSQIDFAPTILGMLDFDYTARFFGHDLAGPGADRAAIGNYQTLGLLENDELCLLRTKGATLNFRVTEDLALEDAPEDRALLDETIACYQAAAASFLSGGMKSGREVEATRK
jgi:phosphoglycerol transferase MdoB-like AlkP superfamily enzyme